MRLMPEQFVDYEWQARTRRGTCHKRAKPDHVRRGQLGRGWSFGEAMRGDTEASATPHCSLTPSAERRLP